MKKIITFTHKDQPVPDYELPEPPGQEVAELIYKLLITCGAEFESSIPISGEGGWSMWFSFEENKFSFFLNTAGIGNPIKDYWVVAFSVNRKGLFGFLSKSDNTSFINLLKGLYSILEKDEKLIELQWWEENAFVAEILKPGTEKGTSKPDF